MTRKKGMMDISLAKRLVEEIKATKFCDKIVVSVMGEPLLHPNFFEILRHADTLHQKMIVITNGEKLDEETARQLLDCRPSAVMISYHAHNDQSFSLRHPSISYEEYQKRVFRFIELKYATKAKTHICVSVISTIDFLHDKFRILDTPEEIHSFKTEWLSFAKEIRRKYRLFGGRPVFNITLRSCFPVFLSTLAKRYICGHILSCLLVPKLFHLRMVFA